MTDRRQTIDKPEPAAAEHDLISQLALNKGLRLRNSGFAAGYPNAANDHKHHALLACEERVKAGRKLVARQRGIVARLKSRGHPTGNARRLLLALQETLALIEQQRDMYRRLKK